MSADINSFSLDSIYFYLTDRCNLRCPHCWVSPGYVGSMREYNRDISGDKDIEMNRVKESILEAKGLGLSRIKLTGGEPFLRYEELLEFIPFLHQQKLSIDIETNGILLDEAMVKVLREAEVSLVAVSLDGAAAKSHDSFRGVKGSFRRAIGAIKLLRKYEIPTEVIMALYRGNLHELEDLAGLCYELGVQLLKVNPITPAGRGKNFINHDTEISTEELIQLNRFIEKELTKRYNLEIHLDLPPAFWSFKKAIYEMGFICHIHNLLGLLANGDLSICGIAKVEKDLVLGNIQRDRIKDVWNTSQTLSDLRSKVPKELKGVCSRCIFRERCSGYCRANAYTLTKDLTAPFWFCQKAYEEGLFPESRLLDPAQIPNRGFEILALKVG